MFFGWHGFTFMKKLQHLKSKLKACNKEVFGNVEKPNSKISLDLEMLDILEEKRELNQVQGEERKRIKIQYEKLLRDEEIKWR